MSDFVVQVSLAYYLVKRPRQWSLPSTSSFFVKLTKAACSIVVSQSWRLILFRLSCTSCRRSFARRMISSFRRSRADRSLSDSLLRFIDFAVVEVEGVVEGAVPVIQARSSSVVFVLSSALNTDCVTEPIWGIVSIIFVVVKGRTASIALSLPSTGGCRSFLPKLLLPRSKCIGSSPNFQRAHVKQHH